VISRERGKDREVFTCGTYLRSFVTQIFHNGQPSHDGDRKIFEVMTSTLPKKEPLAIKCSKIIENRLNQRKRECRFLKRETMYCHLKV
jgi:hypothetical protein